ncbi:MAG: hypothetical protein J2P28_09090, partial [Actinobacteria bacterium]|nr:hypothetical protein [Actinomycetota bacterium]
DGADSAVVVAEANGRRRTAGAEPWQTILPAADYLALVEQAGWAITQTQWAPAASRKVSHGHRSLLVRAGRA